MSQVKQKLLRVLNDEHAGRIIKSAQNSGGIIANCAFHSIEIKDLDISGISFENCTFDTVLFQRCQLKEVTFSNSMVGHSSGVTFFGCKITELDFGDSILSSLAFLTSSIRSLGIADSFVNDLLFARTSVLQGHIVNSCLDGIYVKNSNIKMLSVTGTPIIKGLVRYSILEGSKFDDSCDLDGLEIESTDITDSMFPSKKEFRPKFKDVVIKPVVSELLLKLLRQDQNILSVLTDKIGTQLRRPKKRKNMNRANHLYGDKAWVAELAKNEGVRTV